MEWVGWTLVSLICWGAWPILSKLALRTLTWSHLLVAAWLVNTVAVVVVVATRVDVRALASTEGAFAIAAGVVSLVAVVSFFQALRSGTVATVTALSSLYPVVTALLAALVLREASAALQWLGVGLAVLAVVFLSRG